MKPAKELSQEATARLNAKVAQQLEQILKEKFPGREPRYTVENASSKGENYLGVLYRVTVHLDDGKKFKLIAKVTPDNPMRREQFMAVQSFTREVFVYETLFPIYQEFQKSKGLKEPKIFNAFPHCYGIVKDEFNEAFFLEDLCETGYRMFDRFKNIDDRHVRLAMQSYGRLHACSFALEAQQPQKLAAYHQLTELLTVISACLKMLIRN